MLKMTFLSLNFPPVWFFQPQFLHCWTKIFRQKVVFRQLSDKRKFGAHNRPSFSFARSAPLPWRHSSGYSVMLHCCCCCCCGYCVLGLHGQHHSWHAVTAGLTVYSGPTLLSFTATIDAAPLQIQLALGLAVFICTVWCQYNVPASGASQTTAFECIAGG